MDKETLAQLYGNLIADTVRGRYGNAPARNQAVQSTIDQSKAVGAGTNGTDSTVENFIRDDYQNAINDMYATGQPLTYENVQKFGAQRMANRLPQLQADQNRVNQMNPVGEPSAPITGGVIPDDEDSNAEVPTQAPATNNPFKNALGSAEQRNYNAVVEPNNFVNASSQNGDTFNFQNWLSGLFGGKNV